MEKYHYDDVDPFYGKDCKSVNVNFFAMNGIKEGFYCRDVLNTTLEDEDVVLAFENNGVQCWYVDGKIEGCLNLLDDDRNVYARLEFVDGELICDDGFELFRNSTGKSYQYHFKGVKDGYITVKEDDHCNLKYNFTLCKSDGKDFDLIKATAQIEHENKDDDNEDGDDDDDDNDDNDDEDDDDDTEDDDDDEDDDNNYNNVSKKLVVNTLCKLWFNCFINEGRELNMELDETDLFFNRILGEFKYDHIIFSIY